MISLFYTFRISEAVESPEKYDKSVRMLGLMDVQSVLGGMSYVVTLLCVCFTSELFFLVMIILTFVLISCTYMNSHNSFFDH
jgi:hypothetical protein